MIYSIFNKVYLFFFNVLLEFLLLIFALYLNKEHFFINQTSFFYLYLCIIIVNWILYIFYISFLNFFKIKHIQLIIINNEVYFSDFTFIIKQLAPKILFF